MERNNSGQEKTQLEGWKMIDRQERVRICNDEKRESIRSWLYSIQVDISLDMNLWLIRDQIDQLNIRRDIIWVSNPSIHSFIYSFVKTCAEQLTISIILFSFFRWSTMIVWNLEDPKRNSCKSMVHRLPQRPMLLFLWRMPWWLPLSFSTRCCLRIGLGRSWSQLCLKMSGLPWGFHSKLF